MKSGICLSGWSNESERFYILMIKMTIRSTKFLFQVAGKIAFSRVILIGLLFFSGLLSSFGQLCTFRGDTVIRIEITSSAGYCKIHQKATIGKTDSLALSPSFRGWHVDAYFRDRFKYEYKNERLTNQRKALNIKTKWINNDLINSLLQELNCSYYPLNYTYFGLDSATFIVSAKAVKAKVRKGYGYWWLFPEDHRSSKCISASKDLSDVRLFNTLLKTEFDTVGYSIISDVWSEVYFSVITASKSYRFQGVYPNTLNIPWYDLDFNADLLPKNLVNPRINKYLLLILPKKFYRIEDLQLDKIIDRYIEWYLEIKSEGLDSD